MPFSHIPQFWRKIVDLLFPLRHDGRMSVDFSRLSPRDFARSVPKSTLRTATLAACLSYKNPSVRALVWHIKTKKDRHAATCAGYILYEKLREIIPENMSHNETETILLVPIPINAKRRRERGYNQCELLAREMQKQCADGHRPGISINTDMLSRVRNKKTFAGKTLEKQAFKKREERIAGMRGAFRANPEPLRKNPDMMDRTVVIIDDVLTTGSTMDEAILTLQNAGYKKVFGLALAH